MSQKNVDTVKRALALFNSGDRDAVFDLYDADVEWRDVDHAPDVPGLFRGVAAVRELVKGWDAAFDNFRGELIEYIEVGDCVVGVTCWRGEGKGSGLMSELHRAEVYEFADGKVSRVTMYPDKSAALEAVGLRE